MDGTAKEIVLDQEGICNFCHQAQRALKEIENEKKNLSQVVEGIKRSGVGNKYDCILGLSGGIDSSTTLINAVRLGLRPLCFSVDNGWQDDKAQENVMRLVEGLKVPFYRYTINLERFRALQAAFMKAGQINIEIPTDHILMATTYEMAAKYGIKYFISGGNVATEAYMPESWGYQPRDLKHIKGVYEWAFKRKLTGLPVCGLLKWNYYKWIKGIKIVYLLDYLDYNRNEAIKLLEDKYGWKNYHEKHCESTFTWWFQNFYLFELKGIDKRKAHYSSLINSGQMTRQEAMIKLQQNPIYPQLGIEEKVRQYKHREYWEFPTDEKLWNFLCNVVKLGRKIKGIFI